MIHYSIIFLNFVTGSNIYIQATRTVVRTSNLISNDNKFLVQIRFKGPFTLPLVIAIPKSGFLAIAVLAKEMGYLPIP